MREGGIKRRLGGMLSTCHFVMISPRHHDRDAPTSQPAAANRIPLLIRLYHDARQRELVGLPHSDPQIQAASVAGNAQIYCRIKTSPRVGDGYGEK